MNRTFWNLLLVSPAILGLSSVMSATAIAAEVTATAEANQLATAQSSESKIAEIVGEIVAEPVAAAPAAPENLALNSSVEAAQTPVVNEADAEKIASIEPETSAAALQTTLQTTGSDIGLAAPIAPASAAATEPLAAAGTAEPSPQASDLAVQSSQTEVAGKIEVPAVASTPATKVEIAQTPAAGMGGPIVPVAPQALPAQPSGTMSQVTSVTQLSDVRPTDWAFQALQSLVERYSCIVGYPDGTYRGNRALTRYEFAAGVNACLDSITQLIGSTGNLVTRDDLAILQRLQEEFAAELATLRARVDGLEARSAELEANQFSTTTKLNGEAIFAVSDTFTGDDFRLEDDETVTNFGYRVRLNLLTSFTGRDLLRTRLQAGNVARYDRATATGTNMARLAFDGFESSTFQLEELYYRFPVGNATFFVGPKGLDLDEIAETVTPFNSTGTGAISRFGVRNPAVFRGNQQGSAGASMTYNFGNFRATAGYLAGDSNAPNPASGRGVFNGSFTALGQIGFFSKPFDLGLTYTRKYNRAGDVNIMGGVGSALANRPFDQSPTASDNFGVQVNFKPSSRFQIGGWYGYTKAEQLRGGNNDATIQNGAITLALADFGRQGNLLGFVFGVPPKVTESDVARNRDTSYHLEGFYRFQVNDFISVTPGVYVILNPEHNNNNEDIWVGLLRTTFSF
ncbi:MULTISPECIES: iron uptake porin [unclassified Microcoleus]|uniref:iron uptake porin n=1 Tax=unclassified Microcoleus TaxID=2642155 RepID=UPI002FD599BD